MINTCEALLVSLRRDWPSTKWSNIFGERPFRRPFSSATSSWPKAVFPGGTGGPPVQRAAERSSVNLTASELRDSQPSGRRVSAIRRGARVDWPQSLTGRGGGLRGSRPSRRRSRTCRTDHSLNSEWLTTHLGWRPDSSELASAKDLGSRCAISSSFFEMYLSAIAFSIRRF